MKALFALLVCGLVVATHNYNNCKVVVVGAGWGGAYFAYRLAKDGGYHARQICIFEQADRVGGRTYSFGNSAWEDLKVDLGAYRYGNTMDIAKGIAEDILDAPFACYNGPCTDTTGTRVYADQYGNNAGYTTGIDGLLNKFTQLGGRNVFLNHKLVNVQDSGSNGYPIKLVFQQGSNTINVRAKQVFLNIHSTAIEQLQTSNNILFSGGNYSVAALKASVDIPTLKQFVWYEDAWWLTKLNLTEGGTSAWPSTLPAVADLRYGDGAVKCYRTVGGHRVYYDHRVAGGVNGSKCYGALLNAYVSFDDTTYNYYYDNWVTAAEKTQKKVPIFISQGSSRAGLLTATHQSLMTVHADALAAAGINPSSIAPPTSTVIGLFNSVHNPWIPSYMINLEDVQSGLNTPDAAYSLNNLAAKPVPGKEIYVASEGFGISFGWAEGSLIMVERVLAAHFGLTKPGYVSQTYWNQQVLPYLPNTGCTQNSQCKSTNNCVTGVCQSGKCSYVTRTNQNCSQDDGCSLNTKCSYTAMCYGPPKNCGSDVCMGGSCVPDVAPPLPACHYSNPFGSFNLWWEFVGGDSISIVFQMIGNSYTAFGIGSGMTNADIVVSFTQSNGQRYVRDYYTPSPGSPRLDTDNGGTEDLRNTFIASDGWGQPSKTWFTRKLNTGDSKDNVIVNGTNNFIYAFGEEGIAGQLQYHGPNRNQISVDLSICT